MQGQGPRPPQVLPFQPPPLALPALAQGVLCPRKALQVSSSPKGAMCAMCDCRPPAPCGPCTVRCWGCIMRCAYSDGCGVNDLVLLCSHMPCCRKARLIQLQYSCGASCCTHTDASKQHSCHRRCWLCPSCTNVSLAIGCHYPSCVDGVTSAVLAAGVLA